MRALREGDFFRTEMSHQQNSHQNYRTTPTSSNMDSNSFMQSLGNPPPGNPPLPPNPGFPQQMGGMPGMGMQGMDATSLYVSYLLIHP
jgi:hypothetical protein